MAKENTFSGMRRRFAPLVRPILERFSPVRALAVGILKCKQKGRFERCGYSFVLPSGDFGVTLETESTGDYEPVTTKLIESMLTDGMTFIDIGAHVGLFALPASLWVGDRGRVVAFEPHPDNYSLLVRNAESNGIEIELVNAAVSDQSGNVQLHASAFNSGDHQLFHSGKRKAFTVACVTLDEFLETGTRVDMVKIDVQGAEAAVLRGMERILTENDAVTLIWELSPSQLREAGESAESVLNWLGEMGFSFTIVDDVSGDIEPATISEVLERCPSDSYVNIMSNRNA